MCREVANLALAVIALGCFGCRLDDKFRTDASTGDDLAIFSGDDMATDDMSTADMALPPGSDLAGVDMALPTGPAPQWTPIASPVGTKFFNSVWGPNADSVFIVGESGLVLHSTDRGATWTGGLNVAGTATLRGIWGTGNNLFVVGDSGSIYYSTNGGSTWTAASSISPAFSGEFTKVWGSSASNVFAIGDAAMIYRSTDGGATWAQSNTGVMNTTNPQTTLQAIWGSAADDIYVVGAPGCIYHSTDGANWTKQLTPASGVWGVWGSSPTDVYATGPFNIFRTVNHGTTWTTPAGQISQYADRIAGVGPGTFYLMNDSPMADLYYVTNFGATLTRITNTGLTSASPIVNLYAFSPVEVYVVGQGIILHGHL